MKSRLLHFRKSLLATAFALCVIGASASHAALVFNDTFDYDGDPDPQTNINDEQLTRQAAGTTTSTYTKQLGGAGTRDAMLTVANGQNQLRFQTTNSNSSASNIAVDLVTNFGTSLAGTHYKITLTDLAMIRGNTDVTDIWFAIAVGDGTSVSGPADADTDVGLLIRHGAPWTGEAFFEDGNLYEPFGTAATDLTVGFDYATRYASVELHIDETGAQDVAWAYFKDMSGNEFTTASVNVDFENLTNRYFELSTQQNKAGTAGTDVSAYLNNLSITIVPEPSAALLGGLGLLALLRRRR